MSTPLYWVGELRRAFFQILFSIAVQTSEVAYLLFCNNSKLICKNLILFVETPFIQTSFHDFSRTVTLTDNTTIDSCTNFWTLRWLSKVFLMFFALLFEMPKNILTFFLQFLATFLKISIHDRKMKSLKESISGVRVSSLVVATAKKWRRWSAWMRLWGSYYHFISTQLWTNSIKECD